MSFLPSCIDYNMNPKDMHTYTRIGLLYNRRRRKPAIVCTLDQVRAMCRMMEDLMPGTELQVEGIGGGGIEFTNTHYKSYRFLAQTFPWIHDPQMTKGSFSLTNGNHMSIFLKSFYDAPPFTEEELSAYIKAFETVVWLPFVRQHGGNAGWIWYTHPTKQLAKHYKANAR